MPVDPNNAWFYFQNLFWRACPKCGHGVDVNQETKKVTCPEVDCEFEITFEDWKKLKEILKKPNQNDTPYSPHDMAERKRYFAAPRKPVHKKPRKNPDLFSQTLDP